MSTVIHPTAVVADGAELDEGVEVGPFAVIGAHVRLGAGSTVGAHAVIDGHTTLGKGTRVFPQAAVGCVPQDLKYRGEPTRLECGEGNMFREFSTVHIGTAGGGGATRLGSNNLVMSYSHVAHDCVVGDGCILANGATLAGHVTLGDHVTVGGLAAIHQFVRIGDLAFVSGGSMVTMDVPPYCTCQGDRASVAGLNTVGLTRAGFDEDQVKRIKAAYKTVFRAGLNLKDAIGELRGELGGHDEIDHFLAFLEASERGLAR
jgi:UDP-N-acetylglucosamine acyltransferase